MLGQNQAPYIVPVLAPAKVNFFFDILNRREDGFHDILSLFQAINLQDVLTFKFSTADTNSVLANKIKISLLEKGGKEYVEPSLFPCNQDNLIAKAVKIFMSRLTESRVIDLEVVVNKTIPIGAGLAGGSSNAAATLKALNYYFEEPFTEMELIELGSEIGSDVPFCLLGGTAIGRGKGEKLKKINFRPNYQLILVKPRLISISTPWAYKIYDRFLLSESAQEVQTPYSVSQSIQALENNSPIFSESRIFWNAFETVIFKEYQILAEIKKSLVQFGCSSAHLTGSGPTIYGILKSEEDGKQIIKEMEKYYSQIDLWLTNTIDQGVKIVDTETN